MWLIWNFLSKNQIHWEISSNFVTFLENLNCTHLHPGVSERSCKTIDILWNWKTFFLHHLCISQRYFGSCRDWTCQKPTWENWWKNKPPGYNPKHCFPVRWEIWKGTWGLWVFSSLWWCQPNRRRELYRLVIFRDSLLFIYNWLKKFELSNYLIKPWQNGTFWKLLTCKIDDSFAFGLHWQCTYGNISIL